MFNRLTFGCSSSSGSRSRSRSAAAAAGIGSRQQAFSQLLQPMYKVQIPYVISDQSPSASASASSNCRLQFDSRTELCILAYDAINKTKTGEEAF